MPPKPRIRLPSKPSTLPTSSIKPRAAVPTNSAKLARPPPSTAQPSPDRNRNQNSQAHAPSTRYATWATRGVVVLCGMIFVRDYYIDYQHVKGSSMAPTLNPRAHETGEEDSVIMLAWHAGIKPRTWGADGSSAAGNGNGKGDMHSDGIRRGDVVTFWKPHRPSEISIKRVVGLPGDTVYPLRGYALDPEARATRLEGLPDGLVDRDEDAVSAGEEVGKVVVPYGHLWIEGDNWRKSLDSNDFGPISKGLVIGKARWVWRRWWSFEEVGDAREMGDRRRTRVVEGKAEIPARFLN
ncbi:hypothetical protein J1614_006703 [Plenodomus biglobosus]|nr:hypothetical protein J1614_006703 [Plenodomus biglobosus]